MGYFLQKKGVLRNDGLFLHGHTVSGRFIGDRIFIHMAKGFFQETKVEPWHYIGCYFMLCGRQVFYKLYG